MGAKHNKCCCDAVTCTIGSDDFDRVDNDSLGANWVEKSGDFDIASNTLVTVTPGLCVTQFRQSAPVDSANYAYIINVKCIDTGAAAWKIVCKFTSTTEYDWIEIYDSGGGVLKPKFWRTTAGVPALLKSVTNYPNGGSWTLQTGASNDFLPISICYSSLGWTVSSSTANFNWSCCEAVCATALPAGADGFVGFLDGDFDDWSYAIHWESDNNCSKCDCFCDDGVDQVCMAETLTMTFTPVVSDPACPTSPEAPWTKTLWQSLPPTSPTPTSPYDFYPQKDNWFSEKITMTDWDAEDIWFRLQCLGNGIFCLSAYQFNTGAGGGSPVAATYIGWTGSACDGGIGQMETSLDCNPLLITFSRLTVLIRHFGSAPGVDACDPFFSIEYDVTITL